MIWAGAPFLVFIGFWFLFPRAHGLHMRLAAVRERGHLSRVSPGDMLRRQITPNKTTL